MIRVEPKYTEVLINLMENERIMPLIEKSLSTYPIYISKSDQKYIPNVIPTREELNKKILNYYKYREIGFETVGRFLDELEIAMCEIMPYYNQLMLTMDQDYNMTYNVDYTREGNIDREGTGKNHSVTEMSSKDTSEGTSEWDSYSKSVTSNTPQNSLGITNKEIDSVTYADSVTWDKTSNEASSKTSSNGTSEGKGDTETQTEDSETHFEHIKGNYGQVSIQSLIQHYRELILNIEQMIINDKRITELFMNVY